MGLLDGILSEVLKSALGGNVNPQQQQHLPDIFGKILQGTDLGSIGGLVKQLGQAGLERQIGSWLGNGQNLPVTPTQIREALGNEQIKELATKMGIPVEEVLKLLTQFFPEAVNQASPTGELTPQHAK